MSGFIPPEKGTPEYDAWLDGPRPDAGNGRGQWLRARQLRGNAAKAEAEARDGLGTGSRQRVTPPSASPAAAAANRLVLEAIRDDASALHSDRIRAAQQLIALDRGAEASGSGSDLEQLRLILETLAPHERLAWLRGEKEEGQSPARVGGEEDRAHAGAESIA